MIDPNKLDAAVADPANAGLSDGDFLTKVNAQILTPRTNRITTTTLNDGAVWGLAKTAAFRAKLEAAIAVGDAFGVECREVEKMLDGAGFDPTDPQTAGVASAMVTAQFCSQADANIALNTISYECGDIVQQADLTASRARVALAATCADQRNWLQVHYAQAVGAIDTAQRSGTATTKAALQALFDPNS